MTEIRMYIPVVKYSSTKLAMEEAQEAIADALRMQLKKEFGRWDFPYHLKEARTERVKTWVKEKSPGIHQVVEVFGTDLRVCRMIYAVDTSSYTGLVLDAVGV